MRDNQCDVCKGTGKVWKYHAGKRHKVTCDRCQGHGVIREKNKYYSGDIDLSSVRLCDVCGGTTFIESGPCTSCRQRGLVVTSDTGASTLPAPQQPIIPAKIDAFTIMILLCCIAAAFCLFLIGVLILRHLRGY